MIQILEIEPVVDEDGKETGMVYYITVGHTLVADFTHKNTEGLAICFDKAAQAIRDLEQGN